MERVETDPSKYLASLPTDVRPTMEALDGLIVAAMPGRTRKVKLGAASIGFARLDGVDRTALRELLEHADRLTR